VSREKGDVCSHKFVHTHTHTHVYILFCIVKGKTNKQKQIAMYLMAKR